MNRIEHRHAASLDGTHELHNSMCRKTSQSQLSRTSRTVDPTVAVQQPWLSECVRCNNTSGLAMHLLWSTVPCQRRSQTLPAPPLRTREFHRHLCPPTHRTQKVAVTDTRGRDDVISMEQRSWKQFALNPPVAAQGSGKGLGQKLHCFVRSVQCTFQQMSLA